MTIKLTGLNGTLMKRVGLKNNCSGNTLKNDRLGENPVLGFQEAVGILVQILPGAHHLVFKFLGPVALNGRE